LRDPWWRRRKKKDPLFNDIYEELERLGDLIDETMQKIFDNSSDNLQANRNRIRGFSIKIGSSGKPRIREMNSIQSPLDAVDEADIIDDGEPLVDIIEERNTFIVLAALPGVNKSDIDLRVTENCMTISIDTDDYEWYDEFDLPTKIEPKSARASYKNGVLEVKLEKLGNRLRDGKLSVKK
jgi:HSP20 family protein